MIKNLDERTIVKLGSILQSIEATNEEVQSAYAKAEDNCVEENNDEKMDKRY